jgi:putative aminopeptidase FrvX
MPWVLSVAERAGIPCQLRRLNVGETDAGPIATSRGGVPVVTISVATRYIHSPVTVLAKADLEAAVSLVRALLRSLAEEGLPQ